ncbi:MAG: hypothetical protein LBR62_00365 [Puniceicoccales bacterium]|jgi:hypothetical protein|nr:hypothetical protein [Puniceicoccales bacterium]
MKWKYKSFLWFLWGVPAVFSAPAPTSTTVLAPEVRAETLRKLQNLAEMVPSEEADKDFENLLSPFLFDFLPQPIEVEEKKEVEEKPVNVVPEPPPLADSDLVERVGRALLPRGSIKQGNNFVLFIRDGRRLVVGSRFSVKHRNQSATIEVINIDQKFFELKLNETVMKFKY